MHRNNTLSFDDFVSSTGHTLGMGSHMRPHRQIVMGGNRSHHRDRIQAVVVEHLVELLRPADGWEPAPQGLERLGTPVAHPGGLGRRHLVQVPDQVRPPVAEPEHTDSQRSGGPGRLRGRRNPVSGAGH